MVLGFSVHFFTHSYCLGPKEIYGLGLLLSLPTLLLSFSSPVLLDRELSPRYPISVPPFSESEPFEKLFVPNHFFFPGLSLYKKFPDKCPLPASQIHFHDRLLIGQS